MLIGDINKIQNWYEWLQNGFIQTGQKTGDKYQLLNVWDKNKLEIHFREWLPG